MTDPSYAQAALRGAVVRAGIDSSYRTLYGSPGTEGAALTALTFDAVDEFDRQVETLLKLRYPELSDRSEDDFLALVEPLRALALARAAEMAPPTADRVPFVLVVGPELAPARPAMALTALGGRPGFADFDAADIARFEPIPRLNTPTAPVWLLFDLDRGSDLCNVAPNDALRTITDRGRTPITVAEGIALVTQHPQLLEKNHCFSLVGSRCGDKRVPAIWISKRAPKLGWCWAGNPHTWLGSASCSGRTAAVPGGTARTRSAQVQSRSTVAGAGARTAGRR